MTGVQTCALPILCAHVCVCVCVSVCVCVGEEYQEKLKLEVQKRAAEDKYRIKRRQIKELQEDIQVFHTSFVFIAISSHSGIFHTSFVFKAISSHVTVCTLTD